MRRRDILAGAGSSAAGRETSSFPAPAIAQGIRQLKMVTDWPEALPGLHASVLRFAQTIGAATGGRIKVEVFPVRRARAPVRDLRRGGAGVADMYNTNEGYFERIRRHSISSRRYPLASPPANCSRGSSTAAVKSCGTRSAASSTSTLFLCTSTACQMGGWFAREVTSPETLRGCATGWPEPGAEVLRQAGCHRGDPSGQRDHAGAQVRRPRRQRMGWPLARHGHRPAQSGGYYYYPGFHEPGTCNAGRH